jgi:hypothetical protein
MGPLPVPRYAVKGAGGSFTCVKSDAHSQECIGSHQWGRALCGRQARLCFEGRMREVVLCGKKIQRLCCGEETSQVVLFVEDE